MPRPHTASPEKKLKHPHPGATIRAARESLKLSQNTVAEALGLSRVSYNRIERAKSGVSADMALRIERVFPNGMFSASTLYTAQKMHELELAQNDPDLQEALQRIVPL